LNALIVGADGLLGKHELGEEVCGAIRRLARGRHNLPAVNAELTARRTAMLRALSPSRYEPPGPRAPLDYERPRRRSSRRAA
jgi:hypothetical protein